MSTAAPRLHALTWTVWMVAAAVSVQIATSPLYVTIVLLVSVLVVEVHGRDGALARAFPVMVGLAAVFGLVRVAITALTTHSGIDVLCTLPHLTVPDWLGGFTVGGTIERGAVLQSLAEAYAVVGFVAVFAAWNSVVSHHEVLRAVPCRELLAMCRRAGELFTTAALPLGDGTQTPEEFVRCQSATTGLPENMCRFNMGKLAYVLQNLEGILASLTRGPKEVAAA